MEENSPSKELHLVFFQPDAQLKTELPLFADAVAAGFPSPAEDYIEKKMDLNEYLVKRPSATFFVRVSGDSMTGAGILDGDLLIVDRSVSADDNKIVIGVVNGNFTVKRIRKKAGKIFLQPENPKFKEMEITTDMDFSIWGVVVYVIHKV
ncbi:MAG: translesion error-prone DNA polymerase V autoproteolytic subunit [Bacteroidota bacterium]|nr:translesion error-prone DNA polymerase V autoproteolytic subunit [Bacteroidota bacterium]